MVRHYSNSFSVALWLIIAIAAPVRADDLRGWDHYGGGLHGMQYSSLSQITAGNVHELKEAWRFRAGEPGTRRPASRSGVTTRRLIAVNRMRKSPTGA